MQPLRVFPGALLLALGTGSAGGQTFYNQDGVQLSATARVIDPGAATCRIREERHTTEQYEKLKPNHGQPLDVWRVELVVGNYSGKVLDYLSAHLNVESDWPPCDNWDGLGNYGKPVVWTGPLMSIQDVGSVQPGEERREIEFVLVFHDAEPVLGRWDIDYDFAASASANGAGGGAAAAMERGADTGRNGLPIGIRAEEMCTAKSEGAECWKELTNRPGCYVYDDYLKTEQTVSWTADCSNGLAQGTGTLTWLDSDGEIVITGQLVDGKRQGQWVERYEGGSVLEGSYVDGKKHGRWIEREADGDLWEWEYVNGRLEDGRPLDR